MRPRISSSVTPLSSAKVLELLQRLVFSMLASLLLQALPSQLCSRVHQVPRKPVHGFHDAVVARHARLASAVRAGAEALGLSLYSQRPANALTAIVFDSVDAEELRAHLKEDGIFVAGGQNEAKGRIIRIAMMGYATEADVVNALSALERALVKMNVTIEHGAGVAAAQRALLS